MQHPRLFNNDECEDANYLLASSVPLEEGELDCDEDTFVFERISTALSYAQYAKQYYADPSAAKAVFERFEAKVRSNTDAKQAEFLSNWDLFLNANGVRSSFLYDLAKIGFEHLWESGKDYPTGFLQYVRDCAEHKVRAELGKPLNAPPLMSAEFVASGAMAEGETRLREYAKHRFSHLF